MDAGLARRLAAKALGTGLLIIFGPGSVVAALTLAGDIAAPRTSPGADTPADRRG